MHKIDTLLLFQVFQVKHATENQPTHGGGRTNPSRETQTSFALAVAVAVAVP